MKIRKFIPTTLLAIALAFTACGGADPAADTTAAPETTAPVTEALPTTVALTEGGNPMYTFIRSDFADERVIEAFSDIVKAINKATGVQFRLGTDWVKRDTAPDATTFEILYGKTNHPETLAAASRVGADGYAVIVEGNKIVIYGSDEKQLSKASHAFLEAVTKSDAGEIMLDLPAGGILQAGEPNFFANGSAADYVIVAGEAGLHAAQTLQKAIKNAYSYEIPINDSSAAAVAREILIGDCGRAPIKSVLESLDSKVSYTLRTDGEKLILGGMTQFSNIQAVEFFIDEYATSTAAALHVPATLAVTNSALANAEQIERTEGTEIRVMSFNILSEEWNDKIPVDGRDSIVSGVVFTYMPDVIGWQEISDIWYKKLPPMIESQYTFVNTKNPSGQGNYTGMSYNKNTVKLIEDGCELFSQGNSPRLRLMNWGVFETIATGERFAVINTHLDINRSTEPKNAFRVIQAREMGEKVGVLQKTYNCPVIITGDYNCNKDSEEYKIFMSTSGAKDAQWTAEKTVNSDYKSTHNVYMTAGMGDSAIDHITYTDGVTALLYVNHNFAPVINASDHNPLMVDFKIN